MEYENDNLDSFEQNMKNMNHAVERDDYTDNTYYFQQKCCYQMNQ